MAKHNYPKTRKPRNTDYAKSTKLLKSVSEETLKEIFSRVGMYLAGKELSLITGEFISPYVAHYTRRKLNNEIH